ncbi:MAG: TolC family protein [Bacteroidetes bacterium]|nr:TolC family protein [Bacteroidota bacterium]
MKSLYRYGIAAVLCFLFVSPSSAQETRASSAVLRLDEAVARALARAPERRKQEAIMARRQASRIAAGTLPNPTVAWVIEELRLGDGKYSEWTASAELPLGAFLLRGARLAAADLGVQAAAAEMERATDALVLDVRLRYVDVWHARVLQRALEETEPRILAMQQTIDERAREGDISVYERKRLQGELATVRWRRSTAAQEYRTARDALAGLLRLPTDSLDRLELRPPRLDSVSLDITALERLAKAERADLEALRTSRDALSEENAWRRWAWLADIRVGGGYKRQSDAFAGPLLTISAPLPLFDRDQATVHANEAQRGELQAELAALELSAEMEIRNTAVSFQQLREQLAAFPVPERDERAGLLATATEAYREGEFSLVEYLDAVTAHVDGAELAASLLGATLKAAFRLEHAVGRDIFTIQY